MVLLFTSLYMTKELHFSIATAGVVMSFYGLGSVMGSYTGGWLTDRRNPFDVMMFSLIAGGIILPFALIAVTPVAMATVIFCYAFAADMFRPANTTAVAIFSTSENRTRSISLVRLAVNLGFSIGPAIGGFVAAHLSYKLLFLIDASSSFLAAAMLFAFLPRPKDKRHFRTNPVLQDRSTSAYRDFKYLIFILLVALYGTCFFQLFASMPQYFDKVCRYNEETIGLLLAFNGLLVVMIEMPIVAALEKKKNFFSFIITGVLCLPAAFIILQSGEGIIAWAVVYTFLITMAEIFAMPFMMNFSISRPPEERQGQYSALYSISFGIANIIAPSVGLGIAGRFGFDAMFYFLIALSLFVALGFQLIKKELVTS